ncbi:MAG: hypothetical protein IPG96_13705 [Proteobacteria bacterium]|nr:hypothetical protein [Pseudomonadota bacterium]
MGQHVSHSRVFGVTMLVLWAVATGEEPAAARPAVTPPAVTPPAVTPPAGQAAGVLDAFDARLTAAPPGSSRAPAAPRPGSPSPTGELPAVLSEQVVLARLERPATHPQVRRAQSLRRGQTGGALERPFVGPDGAAGAAQRAAAQATAEYRRYHALAAALAAPAARGTGAPPAPSAPTPAAASVPVGSGRSVLDFSVGAPNAARARSPQPASRTPAAGAPRSDEDGCVAVARLGRALALPSAARAESDGAVERAPRAPREPKSTGSRSVPNRLGDELSEPPVAGRDATSCVAEARRLRSEALELQSIFGSLAGWVAFEAAVVVPLLATQGPARTPPNRIRYLGH